MRKLINSVVGVITLCVINISCDKDSSKDELTPKNYINYDGKNYELSQGILENYGGFDGVYNFDLTLFSSDYRIYESGGEVDSIMGIGGLIYFEIYTSDSVNLSIGDYLYYTGEIENQSIFDYAFAIMDYNSILQSEVGIFIAGGKLRVIKNSTEYEISFDCIDIDGKEITGYYKGSLGYYDYRYYLK